MFREHPFILQIPMDSFIPMPVITDRELLHINILEIMAIRFALKKAIRYIHHSCVMISTHSPNLCVEVWEILHWCLQHDVVIRYPRQIQYFGRSSLENGQTSQNRMGIGSINSKLHFPDAQLPQCGPVCYTLQSQTPSICIFSSGSCLSDRRIISELASSSYFYISSNNSDTFCSSQDTSVSF